MNNIFENYYGKPQGTVNLYGINFPIQWYNLIWGENNKAHQIVMYETYKDREVVPKENAFDLVCQIWKLCSAMDFGNYIIAEKDKTIKKYELDKDNKNELMLANNDILKHDREVLKISDNNWVKRLDNNDNYYKEIISKIEDNYNLELQDKLKNVSLDIKHLLNYIDKDNPLYDLMKEKYNIGDEE